MQSRWKNLFIQHLNKGTRVAVALSAPHSLSLSPRGHTYWKSLQKWWLRIRKKYWFHDSFLIRLKSLEQKKVFFTKWKINSFNFIGLLFSSFERELNFAWSKLTNNWKKFGPGLFTVNYFCCFCFIFYTEIFVIEILTPIFGEDFNSFYHPMLCYRVLSSQVTYDPARLHHQPIRYCNMLGPPLIEHSSDEIKHKDFTV